MAILFSKALSKELMKTPFERVMDGCFLNIYDGRQPPSDQKKIQDITLCTFQNLKWVCNGNVVKAVDLRTKVAESGKMGWFCIYSKHDNKLFLTGTAGTAQNEDMVMQLPNLQKDGECFIFTIGFAFPVESIFIPGRNPF